MYDCDPGGLLVVLIICRCVNKTEATMETGRRLRKMGVKLTHMWGAKLKVSLWVSPRMIVTVDSRCYVYTSARKCGCYLCRERRYQHGTT